MQVADIPSLEVSVRMLVFRYSVRCPRTFAADVDSCNTKHLTYRHVLRFHQLNQLITVDSELAIDTACKSAAEALHSFLTIIIIVSIVS